ncbi:MAG: trehalose-phosphatase [Tangfeifania sp.]
MNEKEIHEIIQNRKPVLFLDYDGTLTPIVKRPEDALISDSMRSVLKKCAAKFKVAVVSGRDMDDLKSKVQVDKLIFAGSHGFRISGPDGLYKEHEKADVILPRLSDIEEELYQILPQIDKGIQIDRKRYAVAVHYRNANEDNIPVIKQKVDEILKENPDFKKGEGKKILEIKPNVDWHKGKAVLWIMKKLGVDDTSKFVPIYIGDDVTDEDAFRSISEFGVGILVGTHGQETAARYRLDDVPDVQSFLNRLAGLTD